MDKQYYYTSYLKYYVKYSPDSGEIECGHSEYGGIFCGTLKFYGLAELKTADFTQIALDKELVLYSPASALKIKLSHEEHGDFFLDLSARGEGISLKCTCPAGFTPELEGFLYFGDCFAASLDAACGLRAADGPYTGKLDNCLFDRTKGNALALEGKLDYSYSGGAYTVRGSSVSMSVRDRVFENTFHTGYEPINKNNIFPRPPVGFMTWYAVLFNASEKAVLENARVMKEQLGAFGADTIWVDWEWHHKDYGKFSPEETSMQPNQERYPHGLAYLAAALKEMDLIPALWIGITGETNKTDFIVEHPEAVLSEENIWCSNFSFDLTSPAYLNEYLPKVIKTYMDWGYRAFKWDCLPDALIAADKHHDKMHNPLSGEEALRNVIDRVRGIAGGDCYLLSCSGAIDRVVVAGIEKFDAARIGGDIFSWESFIADCVERVLRFYPYHNTVLYCDADNLVLRPEFNTPDLAVSRVSLYGILGLPVTLGDNLPELPPDRFELLKRIIPVIDAHPRVINQCTHDQNRLIVTLGISRSFEQWLVADILNLKNEEQLITVSADELGLEGEQLVFDFWNKQFLGKTSAGISVLCAPHASRLLCFRQYTGRPQLLSTSRHITQGGIDIQDMRYDEERRAIYGTSNVTGNDPYALYFYDPAHNDVLTLTLTEDKNRTVNWEMQF